HLFHTTARSGLSRATLPRHSVLATHNTGRVESSEGAASSFDSSGHDHSDPALSDRLCPRSTRLRPLASGPMGAGSLLVRHPGGAGVRGPPRSGGPRQPAWQRPPARRAAQGLHRTALAARAVHVFAHSMGGLDARYMISRLGMAKRVLSLTTIATPHRG